MLSVAKSTFWLFRHTDSPPINTLNALFVNLQPKVAIRLVSGFDVICVPLLTACVSRIKLVAS